MFKKSFKKMIVGVGAAVMMMSAMAVGANAADTLYKPGTYSVNAEIYVPKSDAPMNKFDAYYTSTAKPPKTPNGTDNASIEVKTDGSMVLTVPMASNYLVLESVGNSQSSEISFLGGDKVGFTCSKTAEHSGIRYKNVQFKIKPTEVSTSESYLFTDCDSHAEIDILTIGSTTILGKDEVITGKRMYVDVDLTNVPVAE